MFASRYFANRYYAPRYFPKVGADPVVGDVATGARWRARYRYGDTY